MKPYYVVYQPLTGYTKFQHMDYEEAEKEAIRLARLHQNSDFVILKAITSVQLNDVIIDRVDNSEQLPF